ncbi:MAG: sodium/proton-translocating pyrophosphatase, partial [Chloroflexota bacterium]
MYLLPVVPIAGLIAIIFALYLARDVLRRDPGTPRMQEIGGTILEGARAFLNRQYRTIGILAVVTAVVIGFLIGLFENDMGLGVRTAVAFITGAAASSISGFIGMYIAVRSNLRCAAAAQKGLREAIDVALRGGAVSGFLIVALSLLGVAGIFYSYGGGSAPEKAPFLIIGFG